MTNKIERKSKQKMTFKKRLAILKFTMLRGYAWLQMPTLAIIGSIEPLRRKGYVLNLDDGYRLTDTGWAYARKFLDSAKKHYNH